MFSKKQLFWLCFLLPALFSAIALNAQNYSLTLNGSTQYFWAPGTSENFPGTAITVEAWIYPSDLTGTHTIVAKYSGSGQGFLFETSGTGLKGTVYLSAATTVTAGSLSTGIWQHVAMTWVAGGTIILYVNGISVGTSAATSGGTYVSNAQNLMVGDYSTNYWNGSIDEVRIWNDVRTATEIKANIYKEISNPSGDASLIAYYKLNETSGTTAANSSSTTGIDGTTIYDPSWLPSAAFYQTGNCLQISRASSQYVDIPHNASLDNAHFTVEFWIKFNSTPTQYWGLVDKGRYCGSGQSPNDWAFISPNNGPGVIFDWKSGGEYGFGWSGFGWHHVASTFDGTNMIFYVDGIVIASTATTFTTSANAVRIGAEICNPYYADVNIDEIRIWSEARTALQIADNMCRTLTGTESYLVAYYPCNAGSGTTLYDMSANSNNGTLVNNPTWVTSSAFNTWLNTTSTAWNTASNWGRGSVPSSDNVGIPSLSGGSSPAVTSSISCNNLVIGSTVTQSLNYSGTYSIANNFLNLGSTTLQSGTNLTVSGNLGVPAGALNVGSGATLTVTGATTMPGGILNVNSGGFLTTSSNVTTTGGTLTINSDASGTGSLKASSSGTITGNINVERYIAAWSDASHGWHFLSSPVSAQAISAFHTPGLGNDFYKWDEPTDLWINRTATGGGLNGSFETNFTVGRGYLVANSATSTKTFTGTINNVSVSVTGLTKTVTNTGHNGWNFVGNPFPCALQWGVGTWNLNNVTASSCQIWNEANASYTVISTNGYIPAMNGFMVHADVTNASLSIPLDARAHNSTSWYKNQESGESRIMLKAVDPAGNTAQESIIGFDPGATENYDPLFDSYFLSGFAPMMYSVSKGENYALNTLPQWSEDLVIPISFIKNSSAGFSIELVKNDMGSQVLLTDKRDGITHNLSNGAYVFNAAEGDSPERFLLHFKALGIDDQNQKDNLPVLVWNNQNSLCISNPGKLNLTLELFTLTGSELINLRLNGESFSRIPISLSDGMYIARISASNKIKTIKMPVVH